MPYKDREKRLACRRKWYAENKSSEKAHVKKRKDSIRKWFQNYKKSLKCFKCGEDHVATMDFHHNSGKKENGISKMVADESVQPEDVETPKKKLKGKDSKKEIVFKDLSDTDKLLYFLANETENYVGADIEAVAREAAIMALREDMKADKITLNQFKAALKKVNPSVTKEIQTSYEEIGEHFKSARAEEMQKQSYFG